MTTQAQEINHSPLTLGQVLTRIRSLEFGSNQVDFARFLGVDRSTLSQWERNRAKPYRANIVRIKKRLLPYLAPEELVLFEPIITKVI